MSIFLLIHEHSDIRILGSSKTINTNSYLPEPRDKLARMDKSAAVCLCPWSTLLVHCPGEPEFQVDGVGGGEAEAQ